MQGSCAAATESAGKSLRSRVNMYTGLIPVLPLQ